MRSGTIPAAAVGIAIFLAGAMVACGDGGGKPSATAGPSETVSIEGISPSRALLGAKVTIRGSGFPSGNNDVGFDNPQISFAGRQVGYLNGLTSQDGSTLTFNLPDNQGVLLGACAFSQLATNEACPSIGLMLPSGDSQVFVVNANGESNKVMLTVVSPD